MSLTPQQLNKIAYALPPCRSNAAVDPLTLINAYLYILENGCEWRDLPESFGKWNTLYKRINRWAASGDLEKVLTALRDENLLPHHAAPKKASPKQKHTREAGQKVFIRKSSMYRHEYLILVQKYREDHQVKQRVLYNFGRTDDLKQDAVFISMVGKLNEFLSEAPSHESK